MSQRSVALLLIIALSCSSLFSVSSPVSASNNVSGSTSLILLYINNSTAYVDNEKAILDAPATIIRGKMFVPAKFLGDALGFPVTWDTVTKVIRIETSAGPIEIDQGNTIVRMNGSSIPYSDVCAIVNGRLMVKLTWIADATGTRYVYNSELRRVEILYTNHAQGIVDPVTGNSSPVAKFTFGKKVYRIGEPVKYINLSYDPDAEGLPIQEWTGKEEVFFKAGTYPVSLKVTDINGNMSKVFTKNIVISDEQFLDQVGYSLHYRATGSFLKLTTNSKLEGLPSTERILQQPTENRTLLVSDSPETFYQTGILYQDTVNGKGRLYANHQNGMATSTKFIIMATNLTSEPVTVTTTNKGEVFPSVYANLFGHQASLDFIMREAYEEKITITPGISYKYIQMPDLLPGQGMNAIYDIETSGPVMFSFMAVDPNMVPASPSEYGVLPRETHIRGTFPISEINWLIPSAALTVPSRITIGNGSDDPFLTGMDALTNEVTMNKGNYGAIYRIHANNPPKLAILMTARGGIFKGPIMINGELVLAPTSGVITPYDGVYLLARTTGKEKELVIEFTPPAGSNFPINLILWPLEDLE
ncbi:MAG: copper amine oxidase N-terminal domain-containing protein [Paenibacillaceae bacterium]